jgi:hypothetical protein
MFKFICRLLGHHLFRVREVTPSSVHLVCALCGTDTWMTPVYDKLGHFLFKI